MKTDRTARLSAVAAEEIRALLARRQLSAGELATRLGRSHAYISRRVMGHTAFDLDDIEAIAELLEVDPTDLLVPRSPVRKRVTAP